ncbi:MAG: ATP-binding protein [Sphaerochaetaceae bacterium]|nr:ATP-binding protein [Sphaerochaetaceae bacterium]MDX9809616.1 ATP-binding protein [Sphaerochaetaceae bacterium]NLV82965.1 sensor histidine kinase [Spirochaetales bacterium]
MHATLCDFISDIVQNSIEAGSTIIRLAIEEDEDTIRFSVTDNGKGMDAVVLKKACDPFYTDGEKHTRRRVGLGIPFLIQAAETVGGSFAIESKPGRGTVVDASFVLKHVDCPPLGDIAATVLALMSYTGSFELEVDRAITFAGNRDSYQISRTELVEALGELHSSGSLNLLKQFLQSQETALVEIKDHA